MNPIFSVIMPVYNAATTVDRALDSVKKQTFNPMEVIVVDDCSTDESVNIVEEWKRKNSHVPVVLLKNSINKGPAGARNEGIRYAKGNWIAFIDADDEWLPDKLEVQKLFIEQNPDVVMVCGKTSKSEVNGDRKFSFREIKLEEFALANPIATSTVVVKTEVIKRIGGFDESFRGPEDYELWMRIAAKHRILSIERQIAIYGEGRDRISFNDVTFLPQVKRVIEKAYRKGGVLYSLQNTQGEGKKITRFARRKAMAWQYLSASWAAAERGAIGRAMGLFLRSLCWWPLSFRPERVLPLGRMKIIIFIARRVCKKN